MNAVAHELSNVVSLDVPSAAALQLTGLSAGYGRNLALHGVDVRLEAGSVVALVGANGAGKTTLLRAISGLIPARTGEIALFGERINRQPTHKRVAMGIGHVPEGRQIFGPLSIEDNLWLGSYVRKDGKWKEDLDFVYNMFPVLKEKRKLPGGTLSGGQQQMLAMGRTLMSRPKVLLLDEPSMGLAPLLTKEIFAVIERLKSRGMTMLLVEQNATAALNIADHGYVLEAGLVTLHGTGKDLLQDERVQSAYLGM
jgi:branched-chain amino acid transport system ATP-binding protein